MTVTPADLGLPEHAEDDEAAAIAAAISAYLADLAAASPDEGSGEHGWEGKRWSFAGRIEAIAGAPVKVPDSAPADPWAASGRRDRM